MQLGRYFTSMAEILLQQHWNGYTTLDVYMNWQLLVTEHFVSIQTTNKRIHG